MNPQHEVSQEFRLQAVGLGNNDNRLKAELHTYSGRCFVILFIDHVPVGRFDAKQMMDKEIVAPLVAICSA